MKKNHKLSKTLKAVFKNMIYNIERNKKERKENEERKRRKKEEIKLAKHYNCFLKIIMKEGIKKEQKKKKKERKESKEKRKERKIMKKKRNHKLAKQLLKKKQ